MAELREIQFEDEPIVLSEKEIKDEKFMDILVPWIQANKKNQNGRTYPESLLQREVARIQKAVEAGSLVGTGDHSPSGLADIATASHIVKKVWLDKKGKGWAEMRVVGTGRGKNIMTMINQGAQLGVSPRGFGTVDEKTGEVQSDYKLMGIDIVTNPSYKEGVFNKENVFESLDFKSDDDENKLEDELNKSSSPKNKTIVEEKIMKLEDLKKEHPELVKQIEDEKATALKAEADAATEKEKDTEITTLEEKVTTLESEKATLEEEIKGLKEKVDKFVNYLRDHISSLGDLPDVLDGGEPDPNAEPEPVETDEKMKSELEDAKKKIDALETKDKDREDVAKTEKEAAELQTQLKAKLDEILATDEYKGYAELIEDDVTKDGKITIESVEAVEEAVKAAFEHNNKVRAFDVKKAITSDPKEKGHIPDPEGGNTEEQAKEKLIFAYQEAVSGGFVGTFEEWKEKYPNVVKLVIG